MTPADKHLLATTCIHFTNIGGVECKAGVPYEKVIRYDWLGFGRNMRYPCNNSSRWCARCPKKWLPTSWELQTMIARRDAIDAVLEAIRAKAGGLMGIADEVPCPLCGDRVGFVIAPFTGEIKFRCHGVGCIENL